MSYPNDLEIVSTFAVQDIPPPPQPAPVPVVKAEASKEPEVIT